MLAPFPSPFAVLRAAALAVPGGGIVCVMENGSTEDERSAMEMNPITGGGVADDDVLVRRSIGRIRNQILLYCAVEVHFIVAFLMECRCPHGCSDIEVPLMGGKWNCNDCFETEHGYTSTPALLWYSGLSY